MRIILAHKNKVIPLGFQGENEAVKVQFDVSGWADAYGSGTFELMNERPTETVGYPCTLTIDGDTASWTISQAEVYLEGYGRCQLTYTVNDVVAKSVQFITFVRASVGAGELPETVPDWVWEVRNAVATIEVATTAQIDSALYS